MEKKLVNKFGNKYFLLGKSRDGDNYYMSEPEWQCDWYWGGLYLTVFTNQENPERAKDIAIHTHFDVLFFRGPENGYNEFKKFFVETPLTDDEIWKLLDWMKSFYTLKEAAAVVGRGYAYFTSKAKLDIIVDHTMEQKLNNEMLSTLTQSIVKMLSPEN